MRLLVSKNGRFTEIFRVNFYKSKNWSVIGEYLLFDYLESLIPTGINFHSHFIYIENGDYHFSIKYYDTKENLYIDRKTYYNHIAIRKGRNPNFVKEDYIERRNINLDNPLDCFMMGEKLKPWIQRPLGHHFGTMAINLNVEGKGTLFSGDDSIKPTEDDLMIDLDSIEAKIVNLGVDLFSKGNSKFEPNALPENIVYLEKSISKEDLILSLNVIIVK